MLKLQYKDHRKPAIWLVDSRYSIGRDKSSDIIIDEDGVAGFHAELQVENDDRIFLTDAGSASGTCVNGKPIKARTQLRANDSIRIGNVELSLLDPKEQLQKAGDENEATAMTPALQGLNTDNKPAPDNGGWLLRARTGSLVGKEYPVSARDRLVIGRSRNCDVVLPSNHVSRQHAEVYFHGGKLYVKDLGSSNGTYVNRKKVQEGVVHNGDELRFDTLVFEVVAPEGAGDEGDTTQFRAAVSDDMVNQSAGGKPPPAPASQTATPSRPATRAGAAKAAAQSATARNAPAAGARETAASAPAVGGAEAVRADGKGGGAGLWLVLVVLFLAVGGAAAWFLL